MAYSALIDEIRKRRAQPEIPLGDEEYSSASTPRPDPEEKMAGREIGQAILACVGQLIDARRRAITLHLRGLTARRIAGLMDGAPDKQKI